MCKISLVVVAAQSQVRICSRSLAGVVGSNSSADMDACLS